MRMGKEMAAAARIAKEQEERIALELRKAEKKEFENSKMQMKI